MTTHRAGALADALENAANDLSVARAIDTGHAETDGGRRRPAARRTGDDFVQDLLDVELAGGLKVRTRAARLRDRPSGVVSEHAHRARAAGVDSEQTHSGEAYLIDRLFLVRWRRLDIARSPLRCGSRSHRRRPRARAFPAASVNVGTASGPVWQQAFGRLTYEDAASPASLDTVFDLASLTKVIATTSIAMRQVTTQVISLDRVSDDLLPAADGAAGAIEIRHLLDHSSGLPAHLRLWERASGRERSWRRSVKRIWNGNQGARRCTWIRVSCCWDLHSKQLAADRSIGSSTIYLARPDTSPSSTVRPLICAIASLQPRSIAWRGRLLRGEVHDENAAALGGVAAHAGLFGTAEAVGAFARLVLRTFGEARASAHPT